MLVAESKNHLLAALRFDFTENKKLKSFLPALSDCSGWLSRSHVTGMLDVFPDRLKEFLLPFVW